MSEDTATSAVMGRDGRYRCRACDAVVTTGSAFCLICHASLDWPKAAGQSPEAKRPPPPSQVASAKCPRGHGPLSHVDLEGGHVHACASCAGLFVETGSLSAVFEGGPVTEALLALATRLDHGKTQAVDGKKVAYLSCPACDASMARKNFERASGIMVDSCAPHGTWFDGGELQAAAAFLRNGGLDKKERFEAREAETSKREREQLKQLEEKLQDRQRGRRLKF